MARGMSADACHITQPSAEGAARAMRMALRDGGLAPEQVGYVNAHGTATDANDRMEAAANDPNVLVLMPRMSVVWARKAA